MCTVVHQVCIIIIYPERLPHNEIMTVNFDQKLCDLNPYCPVVRVCPTGALYIDRRTFRPSFDESKCTGCEACVPICPHGAVAARD